MVPAWQTGLRVFVIGFFATLAVIWLALMMNFIPFILESWAPVFMLSLVVAVLSGLFAWLRAHISQLYDHISKLTYEIEKLKKQQ